MLKIRLQRVGRKHEPVFRLVLTDSKNSTKSGRLLEILGNYDSRRGENIAIKTDRVTYWLSKGAQPTGTVHNIFVDKKLISGKKINVLPKKKPIVKEGDATTGAPTAAEAPVSASTEESTAVKEVSPESSGESVEVTG